MIANKSPFSCRVVIIGDSSVGKTSILSRFIDERFDPGERSTVGANYQLYTDEIDGEPIEIQLWDTAGQEKFRSLGPIYFRNAMGALAVFDMTNRETFINVNQWIDSFVSVAGSEAVIALAGNKCDLVSDVQVNIADAEKFASERNYIFRLTSAKSGAGIREIFTDFMTKLVAEKTRKQKEEESPQLIKEDEKRSQCNC